LLQADVTVNFQYCATLPPQQRIYDIYCMVDIGEPKACIKHPVKWTCIVTAVVEVGTQIGPIRVGRVFTDSFAVGRVSQPGSEGTDRRIREP